MISSVVARLVPGADFNQTMQALAKREGLEIGELIDGRLLPITIDSSSGDSAEETTRWIQSLPNVAFVDIAYVNWESE